MTNPHQPLSTEERVLAAQLPRLHGRGEPDPTLDARILAAARTAVAPRPALRPRLRWIAPMAVAASLSLAVGLAWRLRPPPAPTAGAPMADAARTDMPEARVPTLPPSPGQEIQAIVPPPPGSAAPPARQRPAGATPATSAMPPVAAPAPPPASPAPTAAAPMAAGESAAPATPTVTPASSPPAAKAARATEGLRERQATSAGATPQAQSNEAAQAADAAAGDSQTFIADDPGEDVPPATADSPEVRDAWLRRIRELLQQGRGEEARASLAEFRRRYPDAPLPPDLRKLEP